MMFFATLGAYDYLPSQTMGYPTQEALPTSCIMRDKCLHNSSQLDSNIFHGEIFHLLNWFQS